MLQFTFLPSTVGVAPGTTTLQVNPGGELSQLGLGVCPPGHYGPAIMLPGSAPVPQAAGAAPMTWVPYATESKLRGLGAARSPWGLLVLSFGLAFASVLGYAWYKSRK